VGGALLAQLDAAAAQIYGGDGAVVAQHLEREQPVVERGAGRAARE
jgi:hypothetical protein